MPYETKTRRQVPVTVAAALAPKSRVADLERLRNIDRVSDFRGSFVYCDRPVCKSDED